MNRKKAVGERLRLRLRLGSSLPFLALFCPLAAEDAGRFFSAFLISTVFSTTCASSVILILESRLQLCMSMRTTGTSLLQFSHLVNALPSLQRLRTVASTRFLGLADEPPAMDAAACA
uniref:Transmembrane protein n=1 Tax=Arundo donax TaxID=35708 RepID=A0A0A9CSM7_ARUDO